MSRFILASVAALGMGLYAFTPVVRAAEESGHWTGALIDNNCGENQKDEAAALDHKTSCALKKGCAASGYQVIVGDKHYKLDANGNKEAHAFLEKVQDKTKGAKVTIDGKLEGDKIEVSSIKAAE